MNKLKYYNQVMVFENGEKEGQAFKYFGPEEGHKALNRVIINYGGFKVCNEEITKEQYETEKYPMSENQENHYTHKTINDYLDMKGGARKWRKNIKKWLTRL